MYHLLQVRDFLFRENKIEIRQKKILFLFFHGNRGNLCRRIRKSWSQVPKMNLSRDIDDFRLKNAKNSQNDIGLSFF